jgi:adenylate cyclase
MSADAKSLLRDAEISAERTVAYVRCGVGITASVFFFGVVAPSLGPDNPTSKQFPYIAAFSIGYLAVGLASFWFARTDRFHAWMTWLLTSCDLCFWYALVVAAVINLELSGQYMLALPPALLVFVILALVALRNDPWLQAYALIVMVVGLIILYVLAPEARSAPSGGPGALSRLFELPPNVARLSIIALAGVILIYVAVRTRRLLNRAIAETVQRANLSRYLPPQLAGRVAQADEDRLLTGTSQDAAVLFVDIRSFTTLAESMAPEALSRFLAEYRQIVSAQVHAHYGVVDKFVGDSVMAVFGAPDTGGNDAANALGCAVDIVKAVANWNVERRRDVAAHILVGVGVHWGNVFCGAVGDATRLEFTVLGDTVNVASRLEQLSKEVGFPIVASRAVLNEAGLQNAEESGWVAISNSQIRGRSGRLEIFARS